MTEGRVAAGPEAPARAAGLRPLGFALVGGLAVVLLLREDWAKDHQWTWTFLLAVMLIGAIGLRRLESWLPGEPVLPRQVSPAERRARLVGIGSIGLGLLISGWLVLRLWPDYRRWQGAVLPWVLSMALVLVGSGFLRSAGRSAPRADTALQLWPDTRRNRWLEAGVVASILALAVVLRTYHFTSIPPGIYVDETNGALDALYINEGRAVSPFGTGWYGTPNAYLYYMAGMFDLLGANWRSLKLVSLIPAILTIPAVYLLGRLMFGRLAGLCAMLLLAVSRWHVSMSRWGWNQTAPPLFQVLSFFFLVRGLRDRRALDYALSGLLLGISIYTYLSARLALATLGLYVAYWIFSDPAGPLTALRRSGVGVLLLVVTFTVTVAPIAVTYGTDPMSFQNRVSEISVLRDVEEQNSLTPLAANVVDILKFFHQTGDPQGKHNLPDEPMIDPFTGLLFAIGLAYAFVSWRDHRRILLLMWLVLGVAGSFLSSRHESPQSYRALTALPAVILMAADVLDRVARATYRFVGTWRRSAARPRRAAITAGAVVIVLLAGSGFWEANVYFGRQATSVEVARGFNPTENRVAHETIAALRQGKDVFLAPRFSSYAPLRFLVYGVVKAETGENTLDRPPWHVVLPEVDLPLPDTGNDVLMLLDHTYWPLRDFISSIYPGAEMTLTTMSDGSPILMRVELRREELAALQGLTERRTSADGRVTERRVAQVELTAAEGRGADVEWDGAIRLEHGGEYEFLPEGGLQVFIDGRPYEGRRYLGRGVYDLHLVRPQESTTDARLRWRVGDAEPVVVPAEVLFMKSGRAQGLLGTYWDNMRWDGQPVFTQITPFLMLSWPDEQPIVPNAPFSARYTGWLRVTEPGRYHVRIEADDGARLTVDGRVLAEGMAAGRPNDLDATIDLAVGDHPVQIDYFQQGGGSALRFFWSLNGGPRTPVPPSALVPGSP